MFKIKKYQVKNIVRIKTYFLFAKISADTEDKQPSKCPSLSPRAQTCARFIPIVLLHMQKSVPVQKITSPLSVTESANLR